jgi:hypothetical protein
VGQLVRKLGRQRQKRISEGEIQRKRVYEIGRYFTVVAAGRRAVVADAIVVLDLRRVTAPSGPTPGRREIRSKDPDAGQTKDIVRTNPEARQTKDPS